MSMLGNSQSAAAVLSGMASGRPLAGAEITPCTVLKFGDIPFAIFKKSEVGGWPFGAVKDSDMMMCLSMLWRF